MSELDVKALKRLMSICRRSPNTTTMTPDCVPVPFITMDAIIAALEDRDRLRAAIDQHNIQRVLDESHEEGWDLAARVVEQDAEIANLQAALEGRDG